MIKSGKTEVVAAVGKVHNIQIKSVIINAYLPPKLKVHQVAEVMKVVSDAILKAKTEFPDPFIVIGGDFNRKKPNPAIEAYPDLRIVDTRPTRGKATLDLIATNIGDEITDKTICCPLESREGVKSDHGLIAIKTALSHSDRFKWIEYKTRPITAKGKATFGRMICSSDWSPFNECSDPSVMADELDKILQGLVDTCFPVSKHKIRSTDDPWITPEINGPGVSLCLPHEDTGHP